VRVAEGARKEGRFSYLSGKRKVPVDVPEPPELTHWLDRLPRASRSLTIAYNEEGLPYSDDGFALVLRKLVAKLAKAGKVNPRLDVHGLRHTRGVEYALAGLTDAEGAAALGHRSPHSFAPYRRQADRIRLSDNGAAKLAKLHERAGNGPVQNTVQNSCKTPGKIGGAE
jgi:integrase